MLPDYSDPAEPWVERRHTLPGGPQRPEQSEDAPGAPGPPAGLGSLVSDDPNA